MKAAKTAKTANLVVTIVTELTVLTHAEFVILALRLGLDTPDGGVVSSPKGRWGRRLAPVWGFRTGTKAADCH